MDDVTTLDTDQLLSTLTSQRDLLVTFLRMWWASVIIFILEFAGLLIAKIASCVLERRQFHFDLKKEFYHWVTYYLVLN